MKKYVLVLILLLAVVFAAGCAESDNDKDTNVSSAETSPSGQASVEQSGETEYQDAEWALNVTETTEVLVNDGNAVSTAINNSDWYTTFANIDTYKLDLSNAITNSNSFTVSPELQPCKDEYKLGLIDDYNAEILMKTSITLLTEGDFASSSEISEQVLDNFRSANSHYDNVTSLSNSYNEDHKSTPLYISTLYHYGITQEDDTVNTQEQTTEPAMKTLADEEPEETEEYGSEETVENTDTSEDSSTNNIFNYCTWQAETTKNIGEYNKAPENKIYVIVTLKIDNTGDQTYTTNPYSWHLKIGDMYYQHDTATYDSSLNHMTTDIGPGGKITTKIAYLVDGDVSVSDLDLYYDGPGSDGVIYS